jgi:hypothetical protein
VQWWSANFPDLLARVQLVAGDMFNPDTLPKTPKGFKVAFVLKQILHDWSDADSVAILKSIRSVMSEEVRGRGRGEEVVMERGLGTKRMAWRRGDLMHVWGLVA